MENQECEKYLKLKQEHKLLRERLAEAKDNNYLIEERKIETELTNLISKVIENFVTI